MTDKVDAARGALDLASGTSGKRYRDARDAFEAAIRAESERMVAAQVRLTHHPVTNPMYFEGRPICDHDSQEWPCLTELQVREGLRAALAATPETGS